MRNKIYYKYLMLGLLSASLLATTACSSRVIEKSSAGNISAAAAETKTETSSDPETSAAGDGTAVAATRAITLSDKDLDDSVAVSGATHITFKQSSAEINGSGAGFAGQILTITAEGIYVMEGELEDGRIIVEADDESDVRLIFNGVSMHCSENAPVQIKSADKVVITLAPGTINRLIDESTSTAVLNESTEPTAALYSDADLTINGSGTLDIAASRNHGIQSKDDLKILGGLVHIEAQADGIKGRDSVYIDTAELSIISGSDGIQSNNNEESGMGVVIIEGGSISIDAGDDGIQAVSNLSINGGTINIVKSYEGLEATRITLNDGSVVINAQDDGLNGADKTTSSVGLSFQNTEVGGSSEELTVTTTVDAASSATQNTSGGRPGGDFGKGFPGSQAMPVMPGEMSDKISGTGNVSVVINGGSLIVTAGGDGLDSNGTLTMNGGTVRVSGPVQGGNGILDFMGAFVINGGELMATGTSSMAQFPDLTSTQPALGLACTGDAGDEISILDEQGETVLSWKTQVDYQLIIVSSDQLVLGENYRLSVNGTVIDEYNLSSTLTTVGINASNSSRR